LAGSRHMRTSRLDNVSPTRVKSVDEVVAGRKDLDVDIAEAGSVVPAVVLTGPDFVVNLCRMDGSDCWPLRPRGFSLLVRSRVVVFGLRSRTRPCA
jgi:hypothetical protein